MFDKIDCQSHRQTKFPVSADFAAMGDLHQYFAMSSHLTDGLHPKKIIRHPPHQQSDKVETNLSKYFQIITLIFSSTESIFSIRTHPQVLAHIVH